MNHVTHFGGTRKQVPTRKRSGFTRGGPTVTQVERWTRATLWAATHEQRLAYHQKRIAAFERLETNSAPNSPERKRAQNGIRVSNNALESCMLRPKEPVQRPEGFEDLSYAMLKALQAFGRGEKPTGYHIALMAKRGLVERHGVPTRPSVWTYRITDQGRAQLARYVSTL